MKRTRAGAAVVLALVGAAVAVTALPAEARSDVYARTTVDVANASLRARGYIDDACLLDATVPCMTFSGTRFRAEATAQARVIQRLSATRAGLPVSGAVQWEVAPAPDSRYAPDVDNPPDPPDPRDWVRNWRIDVVADGAVLFEVKRWSPLAAGQIQGQLDHYVSAAQTVGVRLRPSNELAGWAETYLDDKAMVWCVWGGGTAGHVYFAPYEAARHLTPACPQARDRDPVVPPLPERLRLTTEKPYRQEQHVDFQHGSVVHLKADGLRPAGCYTVRYTNVAEPWQRYDLTYACADVLGVIDARVTLELWLGHGDWGVVELIAPGAAEQLEREVHSVYVTAEC